MKQIKVLVVDDSAFMRKILTDMINSQPNMQVLDTAKNGQVALQKITEHKPDVVTMDIEMPIMNGLEALKLAMEKTPIPIIMLSSLTKKGAEATLRALEYGAVDFIAKPSSILKVNTKDVKNELIEKIEIASKVGVSFKNKKHYIEAILEKSPRTTSIYKGSRTLKKIISIGTSTGGPKALQSVIPNLPDTIDAAVLVVQHMPAGFTKSLADRLNEMSQLIVKEAENGDVLQAGHCYIAPGGYQMRIVMERQKYVVSLDKGELVSGHRPSVDAMYYSLAEIRAGNVIGVIMTGMGSDGAKGLAKLKALNNYTIAQDEASCVVYGMPKSAVNLDVVDRLVALKNLSGAILKALED